MLLFDHLGVSLVSTSERLVSKVRDMLTKGTEWVYDETGVLINTNLRRTLILFIPMKLSVNLLLVWKIKCFQQTNPEISSYSNCLFASYERNLEICKDVAILREPDFLIAPC